MWGCPCHMYIAQVSPTWTIKLPCPGIFQLTFHLMTYDHIIFHKPFFLISLLYIFMQPLFLRISLYGEQRQQMLLICEKPSTVFFSSQKETATLQLTDTWNCRIMKTATDICCVSRHFFPHEANSEKEEAHIKLLAITMCSLTRSCFWNFEYEYEYTSTASFHNENQI